jgi:hypothetical protein
MVVTISFYGIKHVIINMIATNIVGEHWLVWKIIILVVILIVLRL